MNTIDPEYLAAIDLGSNSFHLSITRLEHNELKQVDRISDKVQLRRGLKNNKLDIESIHRAMACIDRFRQRMSAIDNYLLRIVGTQTLRQARNADQLIEYIETALACPVEIIAGREEARLVYLGVAHGLPANDEPRLVMDIGGASTEVIVGHQFEALHTISLEMGCISMGQFFPQGEISQANFSRALQHALRLAYQVAGNIPKQSMQIIGSSGTWRSLARILEANGWSKGSVSQEGLLELRYRLLAVKNIDHLQLDGLKENRRHSLVGGLVVASALFEAFSFSQLQISGNALREGVMYEQLGRLGQEDVRERTLKALQSRYNVDLQQVSSAANMAASLFDQAASQWQLDNRHWRWLQWGCDIHQIGLAVAHHDYHKHGEYLVRHADLPGFTHQEQELLAMLVRFHRGKLKAWKKYEPGKLDTILKRITVILRLAIIMRFTSRADGLPSIKLEPQDTGLTITVGPNWLAEHPLTATELEREQRLLSKLEFDLQVQ